MRCRECYREFPEWTWEIPVCPGCRAKAGAQPDATASRPTGGESLASVKSPLDAATHIETGKLVASLGVPSTQAGQSASGILTRGLKKEDLAALQASMKVAPDFETAETPGLSAPTENISTEYAKPEPPPQKPKPAPKAPMRPAQPAAQARVPEPKVEYAIPVGDEADESDKGTARNKTPVHNESPRGRYVIEYSPKNFILMKMNPGGFTSMNFLSVALLVVLSGIFFSIRIPWVILFFIPWILKILHRLYTTENLLINNQVVDHVVKYFSLITLSNSHSAAGGMRVISEQKFMTRMQGGSLLANVKADNVFLVGNGWRERIGLAEEVTESIWLKEKLSFLMHNFLK